MLYAYIFVFRRDAERSWNEFLLPLTK